ncbi:MAG: aminotransferase class V-fold PLP-dependent enzyme [Myxococcota bacterium]
MGDAAKRAPHNANLGFEGVPAEVLLHALEAREIYVSAGAACASREKGPSHVLRAIGLPDDIGTIRVTLSRETTEGEIDEAAEAIERCVAQLRA